MRTVFRLVDQGLRRYTPDPFVIAILLSAFVVLLATWRTDNDFTFIVNAWGNGFWQLAEFTLHMAMILLGGFVVAKSSPVQRGLSLLISTLKSPVQAVLFCTFAAIIASWINWGFGLVIGGVVALQVAQRMPQVSFRVLVASSYSGFIVWHGGLSGSIPLSLNSDQPSNLAIKYLEGGSAIPLSQTLFSPINLIALGGLLVILPILNVLFLRWPLTSEAGTKDESPHLSALQQRETTCAGSPLQATDSKQDSPWIEDSYLTAVVLGGLGVFYVYLLVAGGKFQLNLNSINFVLLVLGLALHGTPRAFMQSVNEAAPKIAPILIQYPLYAAIMAVLKESGLANQMAELFVSFSSKETFPLMTFYSAGLINLFVPSGGGQWAVQAPIVLPAATELGADIPKTIMAVAWGDAWTNMLQPFWAVPLLSIAGLSIKDIIGFCLTILVVSGIFLSLVFLLC